MIEKEGNDGESHVQTHYVHVTSSFVRGRSMFMDFVDHPYPRMYVQNVHQNNDPCLCILMQQTSYSRNDVPTNQQNFDNLCNY